MGGNYNQDYYRKNAEKEKARAKSYHLKNRDRRVAYLREYARSIEGLFRNGILSAKRAGREWSITIEQFIKLREKSCYYCDGPLPETGYGLDRIDCSKGYSNENVLPACHSCNRKRSNDWSVEEARLAVQAVIAHRRKNA